MTAQYRTATLPEINQMLDWAAAEGWNPGREDAAAFYTADPDGFFVAEIDGAPVAAISVVNHSDHVAFLGLYLCLPGYRGRGIGYGLWQHALRHAGSRSIGLDGVPAQEANYARSGFALIGRTHRMEGVLPAPTAPADLATEADAHALLALDQVANGFARPAFLRAWTTPAPTRKTVVRRDPTGITGFATVRQCRAGCKIGPVVARTAEDALALACEAAALFDPGRVILDLPDRSVDLAQKLSRLGFETTFTTARMVRGSAPEPGPNLHAIATMELG